MGKRVKGDDGVLIISRNYGIELLWLFKCRIVLIFKGTCWGTVKAFQRRFVVMATNFE